MKTKKNLASVVLGAAIMSTTAFASMNGSCGSNMKETKEMAKGSCGADMKKGKMAKGSCGDDMKKNKKMMEDKSEMMDEKNEMKSKGSCGAGKCGAM